MRNMGTGELEDALAAKSMLKRLFAYRALASDKRPLLPVVGALHVEHASHTSSGPRSNHS